MRIFHFISFVVIILVLAGLCVLEDRVVSSSLSEVQSACFEIETSIEEKTTLKTMDIVLQVDNLEQKWSEDESMLCYMVNHKNVQEIGQEIAKLKMYIKDDDVSAFKVSLQQIKFYCKGYLHFMGASIHNVL